MPALPFDGLTPCDSADHAAWVVDAMRGRQGVAHVIPDGFAAYARLLHPLEGGERWAAVAPAFLAAGDVPYPYPYDDLLLNAEGDMGPAAADVLVPHLAASTSTPGRCHYGVWEGWGELHRGDHQVLASAAVAGTPEAVERARLAVVRQEEERRRAEERVSAFVEACATQPWWGGRTMLLLDGEVAGVATIGTVLGPSLRRRGPQWWWPADRAWFVASEIDFPWSYVGGSAALVAAVVGDDRLEAVPVSPSDGW